MQHQQVVCLRERFNASLLHLVFSACVLTFAIYLILWVWYPAPLHLAVGVTKIYLTIFLVSLIIGPLLTLIIYKHDKTKLRFDITIIVLIQISTFLYGMHTVEQGRPAWLVFVVDDFEVVRPSDMGQHNSETIQTEYHAALWSSPQWIAAQYSKNAEIKQQQKEDEMFLGISLTTRSETYVPIEQVNKAILERSKKLNTLDTFNTSEQVIHALKNWPQATAWLPLKAPEQDMVVLINAQGIPLTTVKLKPWD